jgi:hypothetical protein
MEINLYHLKKVYLSFPRLAFSATFCRFASYRPEAISYIPFLQAFFACTYMSLPWPYFNLTMGVL